MTKEIVKIINALSFGTTSPGVGGGVRNTDGDYTSNIDHITSGRVHFTDANKRQFALVQLFTLSTTTGLSQGDIITGGTSLETAEVVGIDSNNITVRNLSGSFSSGETVTSGAFSATLSLIGGVGVTVGVSTVRSTRTTTDQFTPMPGQPALHMFFGYNDTDPDYTLGHYLKDIDVTGDKFVYIDIPNANIEDQTLNTDVNGEGIGQVKSSTTLPTHSSIVPLRQITGGDRQNATDLREEFLVDGSKIDLSTYTGDISGNNITLTGDATIAGTTNTDTLNVTTQANLPEDTNIDGEDIQAFIINTVETNIGDGSNIGSFTVGETFAEDEVGFVEASPTIAQATEAINVGENNSGLRHAHKQITNGQECQGGSFVLRKTGSLSFDVYVRMETDNNGEPSGTLIDPDATATINEALIGTGAGGSSVAFTWSSSFTPAPGQVVWIIIGIGAYESEVPNPTNYLEVYRADLDTTTRTELVGTSTGKYNKDGLDPNVTPTYATLATASIQPNHDLGGFCFSPDKSRVFYIARSTTGSGADITVVEADAEDMSMIRQTSVLVSGFSTFSIVAQCQYRSGKIHAIFGASNDTRIIEIDDGTFAQTNSFTISETCRIGRYNYGNEYNHQYLYLYESTVLGAPSNVIRRFDLDTYSLDPSTVTFSNMDRATLYLSHDFDNLYSVGWYTVGPSQFADVQDIDTSTFTNSLLYTQGLAGGLSPALAGEIVTDGSLMYHLYYSSQNILSQRSRATGSVISTLNVGGSGFATGQGMFICSLFGKIFTRGSRVDISLFSIDYSSGVDGVDKIAGDTGYLYRTVSNNAIKTSLYPASTNANKFTQFTATGIHQVLMAKTDASFSYKIDDVGVANQVLNTGESGAFILNGIRKPATGTFDPKQDYYLSDTPGEIQDTAGTNSKLVARSFDGETLYFKANN